MPFVPFSIATLAAGVLLGVPLCGGAWIVLRRLKSFEDWALLYDRDLQAQPQNSELPGDRR